MIVVLLLIVAVVAAAVGLWSIALVDLVALVIVVVGLRVAFPARRATLTYREIKERQEELIISQAESKIRSVEAEIVEEEAFLDAA